MKYVSFKNNLEAKTKIKLKVVCLFAFNTCLLVGRFDRLGDLVGDVLGCLRGVGRGLGHDVAVLGLLLLDLQLARQMDIGISGRGDEGEQDQPGTKVGDVGLQFGKPERGQTQEEERFVAQKVFVKFCQFSQSRLLLGLVKREPTVNVALQKGEDHFGELYRQTQNGQGRIEEFSAKNYSALNMRKYI
jgi:hypothetical protein